MSTETDRQAPLARLTAAVEASRSVDTWAEGAAMMSLLTTIRSRGWMEFLAAGLSVPDLTAFSGLPPERVEAIVDVLETHGVIVREADGRVRLTDAFAAFAADDAFVGLADVLDRGAMMTRLTGDLEAAPRGPGDALTVARAWGGRSTAITREFFEETLFRQVPEIPDALRAGRWLDIGCGVATTTLTMATLVPEMRATGLELVPEVAAEAVARAAALGVGDRVDIRAMDARDFAEESAFTGAFWAQPFFPSASRPATLAMIRRALRPEGLLLLQEMEPAPAPDQRPAYALRRLVFSGWEVPFGRTAEELADEASAAGFDPIRIAETSFGRIVLTRRPA